MHGLFGVFTGFLVLEVEYLAFRDTMNIQRNMCTTTQHFKNMKRIYLHLHFNIYLYSSRFLVLLTFEFIDMHSETLYQLSFSNIHFLEYLFFRLHHKHIIEYESYVPKTSSYQLLQIYVTACITGRMGGENSSDLIKITEKYVEKEAYKLWP